MCGSTAGNGPHQDISRTRIVKNTLQEAIKGTCTLVSDSFGACRKQRDRTPITLVSFLLTQILGDYMMSSCQRQSTTHEP